MHSTGSSDQDKYLWVKSDHNDPFHRFAISIKVQYRVLSRFLSAPFGRHAVPICMDTVNYPCFCHVTEAS